MVETTPNLTVRTATPSDIPALLTLIASTYRGEESRQGWTSEVDLVTGPRIDAAGLLAKITDPHGVMLLATDPDTPSDAAVPIACCEVLARNDGSGNGFFGLFAVAPKRQGGGLGKHVLRIAENYARDTMGVKRLEMQVIWTRAELLAWYVRRGYVVTGEHRRFPVEQLGSDAGVLRDDLYFEILAKELVASNAVVSVA